MTQETENEIEPQGQAEKPSATLRAEDHPHYDHLRQYKKTQQWDLMRRYNAHAIGIGWKLVEGEKTSDLALRFYVANKGTGETSDPAIPETILFLPEGADAPVELLTDVVESPAAQLEDQDR